MMMGALAPLPGRKGGRGCGSRRSRGPVSGGGRRQRLVQVGDDIGRILDPD